MVIPDIIDTGSGSEAYQDESSDGPKSHDNWEPMTRERWEGILRCKQQFLEGNTDPHDCPYMRQEVAASWIRDRQNRINAFGPMVGKPLSPEEFKAVLEENKLLLCVTRPLFKSFKKLGPAADSYTLYLFDKNGYFLLQEGDIEGLPLLKSTIWNEVTAGTCSHVMSIRHRRPVQLQGPEHFYCSLENLIASSAPIMDEDGEVIAALVLCQLLIEQPWQESFQHLCSHTLGLITTMAAAVEAQIKLKLSNAQLKIANDDLQAANNFVQTAYDTLEATLACVDEGIITVDHAGMIIRSNQEGNRILKLKPGDPSKRNIRDFLDKESTLMSQARRGEDLTLEETIYAGGDKQPYLVNVRPILNLSTGQLEVVVLRLNHAEKINALVARRSGATASFTFDQIIGESRALKKAIEQGQRFAQSPENILLIGESGTGKELFAQAIHNQYRPYGPFIAVNCAALPRELIESELFGYEGGSFTGAERSGRPGKIELAHGGSLFLDEIGDMPFELQSVLLRVLENKQVMRIGGRHYKKVDFRVIAATNKNIYEMVRGKHFREDLFFRLSVLSINLPPLRERGNDAEILSRYFIEKYCRKMRWKAPELGPAVQKKILEYNWPGNVRQLENTIIYAVNSTLTKTIMPDSLPDIITGEGPAGYDEPGSNGADARLCTMKEWEKAAIETALLHNSNNILLAADMLEISRATLYRKIKEYNIHY
jgi:transcriptional regulator with PAS, ATPase and Fis domain